MKQKRRDTLRTVIEFGIILVLSLLPLYWFFSGYVLLGHDAGFRLDYQAHLPNLFYSWDFNNSLGVDWSIFKGFLVTQFPETAFSYLTGSFALGEKIALVFWFSVMGLGMLIFLRRVFPEEKYRFFRLFSSIFYMFNFFILNGWGIGERAKFSLYAALPLGLLLIYDVFVRNRPMIRYGILFGLLYFVLNGGGVLPLFGGTIIVLGMAWIVFTIHRIRLYGKKEIQFSIQSLFAFSLPFFLLNAYYIIPNIYLLSNSFTSTLVGQGGIDGLIAWERVISKSASFVNLIRLQGMPDWYDNPAHPYANMYLKNVILIIASFIPGITIVLGLIFDRFKTATKQQRILLWTLTCILPVGLLFTMGTHPPTGILYEFAMKKIPGFVMFRSSFYKFAPALWFPVIVLTGYFLNQGVIRFFGGLRTRFLVGTVLIFGLLVYHFPFFMTITFRLTDPFTTRIKIPPYIENIQMPYKQIIPEDEATLVLPRLDSNYINLPIDSYAWGYLSLDILPRIAVSRRFVANDSPNIVIGRLYDAFYRGDIATVERLMTVLRIRYVLWRGDVQLTEKAKLDYPPEPVQTFLNTDPHFSSVSERGLWTLYQFNNTYSENHIFAVSTIDRYQGSDHAIPFILNTSSLQNRTALVSSKDAQLPTEIIQREFKEAECIMCNEKEYETLVGSIGLPNQRLLPNSWLFMFQKRKDDASLRQTMTVATKRIDADLALMQNYLSYAKRLSDSSYLSEYLKYFKDAFTQWQTLSEPERNTYAIRISAYIEAHRRNSPDFIRTILHADWNEVSTVLKQDVWMTEGNIFRYVVFIETDGTYTVLSDTDISEIKRISVDTVDTRVQQTVFFKQGFHHVEMEVVPKTIFQKPVVVFETIGLDKTYSQVDIRFEKMNPTSYIVHVDKKESGPFLLVMKEQYDPRWDVSLGTERHVMVDGFANGWIINKQGGYDIEIYYTPQNHFYIGVAISGSTFFLLGILFVAHKLKKEK